VLPPRLSSAIAAKTLRATPRAFSIGSSVSWAQFRVHGRGLDPDWGGLHWILDDEIANCRVLLALMGSERCEVRDADENHRLDDPNDRALRSRRHFSATSP
jgi:hypothetical protein